jgi:hypothetical protein
VTDNDRLLVRNYGAFVVTAACASAFAKNVKRAADEGDDEGDDDDDDDVEVFDALDDASLARRAAERRARTRRALANAPTAAAVVRALHAANVGHRRDGDVFFDELRAALHDVVPSPLGDTVAATVNARLVTFAAAAACDNAFARSLFTMRVARHISAAAAVSDESAINSECAILPCLRPRAGEQCVLCCSLFHRTAAKGVRFMVVTTTIASFMLNVGTTNDGTVCFDRLRR